MTNPNIPPEIRPVPSSSLTGSRLCGSENMAAAAHRSKSLDAMMAGQSAPAVEFNHDHVICPGLLPPVQSHSAQRAERC